MISFERMESEGIEKRCRVRPSMGISLFLLVINIFHSPGKIGPPTICSFKSVSGVLHQSRQDFLFWGQVDFLSQLE